MAVTNYDAIAAGAAGVLADSGTKDIESMIAFENIPVGYGVVKRIGYANQVRLPRINKTILTVSADLVAADSVVVTLNGLSTTATVFASTHDAQMTAIAVKVAALTGIASAVSAARTITVLATDGVTITGSAITVTNGGIGTAVGSVVESTTDSLIHGVAVASQYIEQTSAGVTQYLATETVNVLRVGRVYVYVEESVTSDSTVFLRYLANGTTKLPGMFRKDADTLKAFTCANCRYVTAAGAGEFAILEVDFMGGK